MSKRFSTLDGQWHRRGIGIGLMMFMLLGCNEAEHKKQLLDAKSDADKRIAQIEAKTKEQVLALEKQIETLKVEAESATAKAKADADEAIAKAQATVEDAEKETEKALSKARLAFKNEGKARYNAINKDLAEVTSKASKIPAKAKASYDKTIKDILALQKTIATDMAEFDKATLESLGKTKAKLDVDLAKYKALVKLAKTKVPA